MEKSAQRRLQLITRHLISLQISTCHDLNVNCLSAEISLVPPPVIIGGMVLDIHGKPQQSKDTQPRTTVPGSVKYMSGGVARNVAECMSKLGTKPFLISVVGLDMAGDILLKYWESAGLSIDGIRKLPGVTTPVVSNIFDNKGELAAGVASVEAVEKFLTPDFIWSFKQTISSAPVLMIDANLHPQSIEVACKIAAESHVPVFFEPVSTTKAARIACVAKYITCTTPNEDELISMANALSSGGEFFAIQEKLTKRKERSIDLTFDILKPAICLLLDKGIKLLVITIGSEGVFVCFREFVNFAADPLKNHKLSGFGARLYELVNKTYPSEWYTNSSNSDMRHSHYYAFHLPALSASVISLVGAGDCLVGGILASICSGLDAIQSVATGVAVAKAAVESESNVPSEFSSTEVATGVRQILSCARRLIVD